MKLLYALLVVLSVSFTSNAQIIDIPDANFKNALISIGVDTNSDGEISIAEAEATIYMAISGLSIASLEGIEYFVNLEYLICENNLLTELNLVNNPLIDVLYCNDNQLTSLDVSTLTYISEFDCSNNPNLTSIALGQGFDYLTINYTGLTEIDLNGVSAHYINIRNNANLTYVQLGYLDYYNFHSYTVTDNPILEIISFKNGVTQLSGIDYDSGSYYICNNPSLIYVCADESEINGYTYTNEAMEEVIVEGVQDLVNNCGYSNVVVNSYCSFTPGDEYYTIEGNTILDLDNNNCDINDPMFPNVNFEITDGNETGNFISDTSGVYFIPVAEGIHTLTPQLENLEYFTVSPSSITVDFLTDTSPFTQDFCITPNGIHHDLEIVLIPLDGARPGFDADYKLVYKNKGTTTLDGSVDLTFQDDVMDLISTSPTEDLQSGNTLTWNFTGLAPFESREIEITMNINSPMETPPVNGDDVLVFDTSISASETDETPDDNSFTLYQTVVNSFDPNDKTCLEGGVISPEMVGDYVHYRIRFENTGTASAINVVVKDHIDRTKFDLSTLVPIDASHEFFARIEDNTSDYFVEFIFENINLPFDDANNDGYIVFKIKTLDTLVLNDTFENEAEIYFDFNFPIITNVAQTTVSTLSTEDFEFENQGLVLYPNPSSDILHVESKQAIEQIAIYDSSGRLIQNISYLGFKTKVSLPTEDFSTGTYFIKVLAEDSQAIKKFIKE
ncbi:T9SS type A sorting domain-containing protein [Psychroserpens algicola]|uniref:T9SS type A sorting domain-containing protein n=1 Tax=Psychroserpens algicola TaxID=1719034 RepID=UPI001952D548|nr:T9SS type A sorting domain-containing protein [Psychroserpens algicola]